MNGNRASGLKKGYSGPSLHGCNGPDQTGIATQGDFRQASHTMKKRGIVLLLKQMTENVHTICGAIKASIGLIQSLFFSLFSLTVRLVTCKTSLFL